MKRKSQVGIGDAIEVKVVIRTPYKRGAEEKWLPATVCHATPSEIGAAFSDGDRLAMQRHDRNWRIAK